MLATLNLQLSPVELLDDTLTTSASLLPDAGGEARSGFAHLLRLRVGASSATDLADVELQLQEGELLPQGGGSLPQSGSELPTPNLAPGPVADSDAPPLTERPDISLEIPVLYPPLNGLPTEVPTSLVLPLLSSAGNTARPDSAIVSAETDASSDTQALAAKPLPPENPGVTRPEVAARLQELLVAAGERVDTPPAGIGLRERGEPVLPLTKSGLTIPTTKAADINESLPLADLPKRPDIPPAQGAGGVAEQLTELIRPRGVVPQQVQTQHAPLNTQPSQTMFVAAPSTAAASEVTYGAAVQQAMDLIGTPVRDSAWGEQLSERVVLMASNQFKTAEIRLTPAELGPLRVQVSVDDGAANVTFHAQHALTREAIEQALPRLREMLAENGLSLGQADVSEQNVAQGNKDGETESRVSNQSADDGHDAGTDDDGLAAMTVKASNGLVDTFA